MNPSLSQHPLDRADGSTVFSDGIFSVLAAVNGPVEVQRRDELPEEAAIEVNVRPSSGVGGPRERWLETVIQSVIRPVLLVHMHPRTLVQITLQVTNEPSLKMSKTVSAISALPALINAALLALIDGGLPLASTATAVLLAVDQGGHIKTTPDVRALVSCRSVHAMAFDARGEQLLDESSGAFDTSVWRSLFNLAKKTCLDAIAPTDEDAAMLNGDDGGRSWLRNTFQAQADLADAWRHAT